MKKQIKTKPFEWHYVYRGINKTKKEVYHGISKNVRHRVNGSHCKGGTKALAEWSCEIETIKWERISKHKTQKKASEISHKQERNYKRRGYKNILTAGK